MARQDTGEVATLASKYRRIRRRRRAAGVIAFVLCAAALTALAVVVAPSQQARVAGANIHSVVPPTTAAVTTTTAAPTTTTVAPTTTSAPSKPTPVPIDMNSPAAPVFSRIPTPDPVVFLTVDDGIVQDPAVLDYIRQQHIPVTMFPIPAYVEQNEPYFQAIHATGATVQDHTVHHVDLTTLSPANQKAEICGPLDEYQQKFGARPWIFRPPYGSMNNNVAYAARSCGIRAIVLWKAATNDGRIDTQGGPLQAGDIVLMHFRTDLRQNLEVVLNSLHSLGLRPAFLSDYLTPG
jgi:peptidoglycan/xylan/chitin deacetylase (PgdA/CDA1 family)